MLTISFGLDLALNIILTLMHVIAIGLTVFRFRHRAITRRLWWDDWVALVAMVVDCVYLTVLWFKYAPKDSILQSHRAMIVRYWLEFMLFLVVIWATRISLALGIARIWAPGDITRMIAIGMALLSSAFCTIVIVRSTNLCAHQPYLNTSAEATCQWSTNLRILIVVANVLSDALLVAVPSYKLWRVHLYPKKRRLILGAFTASACTTGATLLCAVFQFAPESLEPAKTNLGEKFSYLETGISLIVCNLLVVVTYLHNRSHRDTIANSPPVVEMGRSSISIGDYAQRSGDMSSGTEQFGNTAPYILTEISEDVGTWPGDPSYQHGQSSKSYSLGSGVTRSLSVVTPGGSAIWPSNLNTFPT